jgi:ribose-phosphate pyrophosphokinase
MIIFSTTHAKDLAFEVSKSLNISFGKVEKTVFPDKEKRIRILDKVVGQDVIIFGSAGKNPDSFYMELFFLMDAVQRGGANKIRLVVPYLSYQRQDHLFREGEAVSLDVIVKNLEAIGAKHLITFDLHSIKIPEQFSIPVSHISALSLFAEKIRGIGKEGALVSPDMGGIRRIKLLSEMLGNMPFVSVEKNRDLATGAVESKTINGVLSKTVFIVDDMISTGGTIVASIDLLIKNGVDEIYVFATHPVLSMEASYVLQNSKAKKIFVTNSLEVPEENKFEKLEILSLAPIIASEIKKL